MVEEKYYKKYKYFILQLKATIPKYIYITMRDLSGVYNMRLAMLYYMIYINIYIVHVINTVDCWLFRLVVHHLNSV